MKKRLKELNRHGRRPWKGRSKMVGSSRPKGGDAKRPRGLSSTSTRTPREKYPTPHQPADPHQGDSLQTHPNLVTKARSPGTTQSTNTAPPRKTKKLSPPPVPGGTQDMQQHPERTGPAGPAGKRLTSPPAKNDQDERERGSDAKARLPPETPIHTE